MRLGAQKFVQELVEREVTAFVGRDHYARRDDGEELRGYRNGYRPKSMNTPRDHSRCRCRRCGAAQGGSIRTW